MTYLEGQIAAKQGYMLLWHAEIVSGAYRFRHTFCGGKELTDDEKLADAMTTLRTHAIQLSELVEHLPAAK